MNSAIAIGRQIGDERAVGALGDGALRTGVGEQFRPRLTPRSPSIPRHRGRAQQQFFWACGPGHGLAEQLVLHGLLAEQPV